MARKDNSPAISFFSFQDIITSVTGIMFLVMMMLTLMLLLRTMGRGSAAPQESAAIRELRSQVTQLQEQLSKAANRSDEMRQRLDELRKLDAKSLPLRRSELLKRLQELDAEKQRLQEEQQRVQQICGDWATKTADFKGQTDALKPLVDALKEQLANLTAELAEANAAAERSQKMMRFTWNRKNTRQPLLVECGKDAIRVGTPDKAIAIAAFDCKGDSTEARSRMATDFLQWTETQASSQVYFMLLAKPSTFRMTETLAQMLAERGFKRGREVLPTDDTIVFATATEAPKTP